MSYISYKIIFPMSQILYGSDDEEDVTFSIGNIKSRKPSVIEVKLSLYDDSSPQQLVESYISERAVITSEYRPFIHTFTIPNSIREQAISCQIELITYGIDNNNPLWFSEVMLNEGDYEQYHSPNEEQTSSSIEFLNNTYVNLYDNNDNYLQVIRPNRDKFYTDKLTGSEITILAPHFNDDIDFDSDVSVYIEALNQTNQTIDVLR